MGVGAFTSVRDDQVPTSFEAVYVAHRDEVVQLAWLLTRDRAAAEDLAHDAFLGLFRSFGDVTSHRPYLRRSVVNGVYQRSRRRGREQRRNGLVIAGEPSVIDGPTGGVADVVSQLSLDQRTAIVLRYWAGLRDSEIAEAMGIRPGTARSHLSRAISRLRKDLL
jgi:DNA-directed RNA polymerase specialized sigma24 family protein